MVNVFLRFQGMDHQCCAGAFQGLSIHACLGGSSTSDVAPKLESAQVRPSWLGGLVRIVGCLHTSACSVRSHESVFVVGHGRTGRVASVGLHPWIILYA